MGIVYILFAFVPMFIVVAAILVMPDAAEKMLSEDPQQLLPTLVRDYMPMWLRVVFFGAVLSAVMSTASATMLAPSTIFVENVLRHFMKSTIAICFEPCASPSLSSLFASILFDRA